MKSILAAIVILFAAVFARAEESVLSAQALKAETSLTAAVHQLGEHAEGDAHSLPTNAVKVFQFGPIVITNSMVITILVTLVIVVFAQRVSRSITPVPGGLNNFAEWIVESLYNFLEEVVGPDLIKKTFWFFGTIFLFILVGNWFALIPGVGTIGWKLFDSTGHQVGFEPWLRGANADLNMTSAMALLFFLLWIVWALQAHGPIGVLKHIFAPKGASQGFMKWFMIAIFLFVGVLETLSILFRPVSLSFRLFGNVFAGENILESMMNLVPWLSWLIPLPFYFLELLVGLVQALVFTLLTAVFTLLICEHDEEENGHGHKKEHAH